MNAMQETAGAEANTESGPAWPGAGKRFEAVVVGGGIVGAAVAWRLATQGVRDVLVLEAEKRHAFHQTGRNSGVIHSGLYYRPGSLRAKTCTLGREALYRFCATHGIPHERCGKIVVATADRELGPLEELRKRGEANGLDGLKGLSADELQDYEPHVRGKAGLFVPQTGIVDYPAMTRKLAELARAAGATILLDTPALAAKEVDGELRVETPRGEVRTKHLIACAGLQSDRFARQCGVDPQLRIIPFRGEYYELTDEARGLVKHLIYPVPDARFPFLGVHFTRMIGGGTEAGPNAVLALDRHGYDGTSANWTDIREMAGYSGFWSLILKHWRTGLMEMWRSAAKDAFVRSLQRLLPTIEGRDLVPGGCGIRAQAVRPDGTLVDDFAWVTGPRMIHVLNAPSPAATASLAVADGIVRTAVEQLGLEIPSPSPLP